MNSKWRTIIKPEKSKHDIDYSSPMFFIGSCFSDNISQILETHKFQVLSNPFGVLYNPYSIQTALRLILGEIEIDDKDLVYHNGLWHSLLHHSVFSNTDKDKLLSNIKSTIEESRLFLKRAEYLFITVGTSWVYRYKKSGRIVANCHKIPDREFIRFRLSACDFTDEFEMLIKSLVEYNPQIKIVFTVSPVRHWKDGAVENHLSKSILTVSIHQLIEFSEYNISYFPSYELITDDLRDYRFYNEDMLHPSSQAVNYVFNFFKETYFTTETKKTLKTVVNIVKAAQHRPFNPSDIEYSKFCEARLNDIQQLNKLFPLMDWKAEKAIFTKQKRAD
ncbi:MAG TPA: GSCFA domain-containing protein [Salinivirgaceae bacterium]|nr:GSCFA domain-containing protein [Salinivirgaceae bacterium]HQA75804.1 GSCFA domain-containing protein [Salinivirgaceae bacterium]